MNRSVLIVDDELGLAEMLSLMLDMRGFDAQIAMNGADGLTLAKTRPFSLILTDLMMPVMDGIEMIRNIRSTPDRATTPIIVMTAVPTGIAADERALTQGVLKKPFGHDELFHMIDDVLPGGPH